MKLEKKIKPLHRLAATVEYVWCQATALPVLRPAGTQEKAYARVWAN
jgi:hypothetical protein